MKTQASTRPGTFTFLEAEVGLDKVNDVTRPNGLDSDIQTNIVHGIMAAPQVPSPGSFFDRASVDTLPTQ